MMPVGIRQFIVMVRVPAMVDSAGYFFEYCVVDNSKTSTVEIETDSKGDTIYRTTITFEEKITIKSFCWTIYESSHTRTHTYEYKVTNNGVGQFDNSQKYVGDIAYVEIGLALSQEMIGVTRDKIPEALKDRTAAGVANELAIHYLLSGVSDHAKIADMGSAKKGAIGYDSNAWIFEALT